MLQSRLRGAIIGKSKLGVNWAFTRRAPLSRVSTANPAIHHTQLPQEDEIEEVFKVNAVNLFPRTVADEPDPPVQPKPPKSPSPKIGHTEVGHKLEPNTQQRRQSSNNSGQSDSAEAQKAQKRAQEQEIKDYFKDHKASPLSEVQFADTRKPVTQVTDSPGQDSGLILFKPEQLDSADDTLQRAVEIWQWNKMRGDPDSPHGRVLRELRGEYW